MVRLREVGIPLRPPGSLGVQPWWDEGRVGYGSDRTSRERRVRFPTDPRLPEVRHDPTRAGAGERRIPGDVDPGVRTSVFVSGQARGQAEGEETVRGRRRHIDPEPHEAVRLVRPAASITTEPRHPFGPLVSDDPDGTSSTADAPFHGRGRSL